MGSSIGVLIFIQIVLIALNAIFASAELAVLSINDAKLERLAEQGNKKAKRLYKLTREPAKFLSTIQIAITLSGFLGSAFAADGFSEPLVDFVIGLGVNLSRETLDTIAVVVITLILSYFTLIFGELVPKRIAIKKSEPLALAISGLISGISVLFKPVVWLLSVSTNIVLRLLGIDPNEEDETVSEEEIRMMVEAGGEKGAIDKDEQEFIQNVFEFDDITAGEIATHRTAVTALWLEDNDDEWKKTIYETQYTLYPVCEGVSDNVVGILNTKDYFRLEDRSREKVLQILKPVYFVPETIKADILFKALKEKHHSMAVVMDEYGGMVGIVTLFDLIEKLVGKIREGSSTDNIEDPHLKQINADTWDVVGNVDLSEIEEAIGITFDAEDIDTISGLVFNQHGSIPEDGNKSINLIIQGVSIEVNRIANHQVASARITKATGEEAAD